MSKWISPHDYGLAIGLAIGVYIASISPTMAGDFIAAGLLFLVYFIFDRLVARFIHGDWLYQPAYPGFPPEETRENQQ